MRSIPQVTMDIRASKPRTSLTLVGTTTNGPETHLPSFIICRKQCCKGSRGVVRQQWLPKAQQRYNYAASRADPCSTQQAYYKAKGLLAQKNEFGIIHELFLAILSSGTYAKSKHYHDFVEAPLEPRKQRRWFVWLSTPTYGVQSGR